MATTLAELPAGLRGFLDEPCDADEFLTRCDRFASSVTREHTDLVERLATATERQKEDVTTAHKQAMEADAELHRLQADCDSSMAQLEELEARVTEWKAPLATTMAELSDTQAAHAYVQTLHQLGELTREYDALPPAPGAETAAKVDLVEQLAALAASAGSKRGGSAATGSVLEALDARGSRLRGSLESALASSLSESDWPKQPLQPPGEGEGGTWFQTFTDLTKLQVAAWRHRRQASRASSAANTSAGAAATGGSASFVHGSRSALWSMAVLCRPLLRRFDYHFCGSRDTNRMDKPEWMFAFVEKLLTDHEPDLAHLQSALDAGGVGYGVCEAGPELLRPVLQALRAQLRRHVGVIEDELSGAAGRARLQQQLGSSVAAGSLGVASLAGAAFAGLNQVRSEVQAGHGKELLASGLNTISMVARPMAQQQHSQSHDGDQDAAGAGAAGEQSAEAVGDAGTQLATATGGAEVAGAADVSAPPPIAESVAEPEPEADAEGTGGGGGTEPIDYGLIFAHYINETLIFEKSLANALGLDVATDEQDLAATHTETNRGDGADSGSDDDDAADDGNEQLGATAAAEGKETHVGRPVVGLCLSCVLAAGAPASGPGRRWLELEASQAEEALHYMIMDDDTTTAGHTDDDPTATSGGGGGGGRGMHRLSEVGDGSGKPCLAVVGGLLEVLDQVSERLRLLPSTALRRAFVEHVHVPLLADYSGRVDAAGRAWRRGRRDDGTRGSSSSANCNRGDHYRLGCAIHNSASYVASSLKAWGEEMFFLSLSMQQQQQQQQQVAASPLAGRAGAGAGAGACQPFFEVDRPGCVGEWAGCGKTMVAALADSIMDELTTASSSSAAYAGGGGGGALRQYVAVAISQGIFWLAPVAAAATATATPDADGAAGSSSVMAVHVAAVSEELLQVLADLGSLLRQCEAELTDRAWSALRRAIARQLDGYLFERMLCEMHCTRSGLQQLEHDMQALFGLFDAATGATAGRRARARGGSGGGGGGAALFRRTSDTLALLRLPAERLESLQAALWPHEDGGGGGGACKLTTAQHSNQPTAAQCLATVLTRAPLFLPHSTACHAVC